MRDCVILINDRLVSLSCTTHFSSLNPQLLLSLVHPSVSESWSELSGSVGTVEKAYFVCLILPTEHLIELVQDIFERELYASLLTIIDTMSARFKSMDGAQAPVDHSTG
jgi:hypothetical protein